MRLRHVYWVSPDGDERWKVRREGALQLVTVPLTRAQAVSLARQIAAKDAPSQLFIQRTDGTIEAEHTYESAPLSPEG